jgi:H+/gluconate symporter-like permease
MTALPGTPSIQNNIPASVLGTPLTAAPGLGLFASLSMFVLGMLYFERERMRAAHQGEGFAPGIQERASEEDIDPDVLPRVLNALIPLMAVIGTILVPGVILRILDSLRGTSTRFEIGEERPPAFRSLLEFAQTEPLLWTCAALIIGITVGLMLYRHHLKDPRGTLSRGAENAALPLLNTAAVVGFGGVVSATKIFSLFTDLVVNPALHPLVSAVISIMAISGIVGSSSGGLGIWASSLAPHYVESGVSPEVLHRVVAIASGAFDSLPHCGAIITCLAVMGLTHREAYKEAAVTTVLIPFIVTVIITSIAILML